jgi:hypothetical protein
MGQFLRINGDYNIQAIGDPVNGGIITLDTGPAGTVIVTGGLQVEGETVYVAATNLDIEDNVITLNKGELGAGVTLDYSGIQIDRGSLDDVSLIWDENIAIPAAQTVPSLEVGATAGGWKLVGGGTSYTLQNSRLKIRQLITDSTVDSGDLTLIGQGTGVVKVYGTDNYEDQVTNDDDLPNKKYVDDAIQNNPTFQIVKEDTRVIIADKEVTPNNSATAGSLAYYTATTGYNTFGQSAVSVLVDAAIVAQFFDDKLLVGTAGLNGIEIDGINFEIRTEASVTDQDIFINTGGALSNGKLRTNYALQLDQIPSDPSPVAGATIIRAGDPGLGTSGVYFTNDSDTTTYRTGELISKDRALAFSMLF